MKRVKPVSVYILLFLMCTSVLGMLAFKREHLHSKKNIDTVTIEEFKKRIANKEVPVLVYFSAPWCVVCKKVSPVVDEIQAEYGKNLDVLKVDTNRDKALAEYLEIDALPVIMYYKKDARQWIHVGLIDKAKLKSQIKK
jgi:thioredoxin 1